MSDAERCARPLGVGLVGCGSIAVTAHAPALAKLPKHARLIIAADVDAAAAERLASPFGAAWTTDADEVFARPDVDLVILATPEFLHRTQTEAAAAAGKHVLCEKPMAPSLADADAMIAACESAGVYLMVGHSRRATTRYALARRLVQEGRIGEVRAFRENERRARAPLGQEGLYWSRRHWTGDPERSVGVALTNAIHETDLFGWFLGAQPVSVYAESRVTRADGAVPDFISISVGYDNGAVAGAEVNNSVPPGYPGYHQFELIGTLGRVTAQDLDQQALTLYRDAGATAPDAFHRLLRFDDAYVAQLGHMVRAVRDGVPPPWRPPTPAARWRSRSPPSPPPAATDRSTWR
jgi:predicted dehydrogenase